MLMAAESRSASKVRVPMSRARGLAALPSPSEFGQEHLAHVQRARILAGAILAVGEHGPADVTIAEIVQRSGVSRRTFYELFSDRDDCLVAACDDALAKAVGWALPTVQAERGWLGQLRAGVVALMSFFDEEPQLARLLVCDSQSGGRALSEWRSRVVARLVAFVDGGCGQGHQGGPVPSMQAEGSVGGALTVLQSLLSGGQTGGFTELSGSLVAMIAMPYIGSAAARRELERPMPSNHAPASAHSQRVSMFPLKEAGMRLTYRTMRVLLAIAARPGASNREVGDLAEIGDQGQTSKLLRRLQRAELVSNEGVAPGQGAPNVWRLTPAGTQLAEGFSVYSDAPRSEKTNGAAKAPQTSATPARRRPKSNNPRRGK